MIKCALQYILEIKSNRLKSNQMLVLEERGKPEYPEKNLSEQSREPKNSAHMTPSPGIEPGPHWWEASAQPLRLIPAPLALEDPFIKVKGLVVTHF